MPKNYDELIKNVKLRSNPLNLTNTRPLFEGLSLPYSQINEYVKLAMMGVPADYTAKSKETAKKVIAHLERSHGTEVEFKFQGSVETNTHILSENDVDVVQISNKSYSIDRIGLNTELSNTSFSSSYTVNNLRMHSENFTLYNGNQITDILILRLKSEDVLQKAYTDVNISKPKAICVNIKSPLRNVDVVTAIEYKSVEYMKSNDDFKMGIQIYDKEKHVKLPVEYPFWSIKKINDKSEATNGRLKRMIRFLKNIKFDSSNIIGKKISISSFDINAICFDIAKNEYENLNYIQLVPILHKQLKKLSYLENYRNDLKSVDEQEYIFRNNPEKLSDLRFLLEAVDSIMNDVTTLNLL